MAIPTVKYTSVPGTWGYGGEDVANDWWMNSSEFAKMLKDKYCLEPAMDIPFVWSTDADGVNWFAWVGGKAKHLDWKAAGRALGYYLQAVPYRDRNVIAHSHGGQVALYAASQGVELNNLVTVATPIRRDMKAVIEQARPAIANWTHVYSDRSDWMQILGSLFDGGFGLRRKMPLADQNIRIPNVGHSRILNDPTCYHVWGMLSFYLGAVSAASNTDAATPESWSCN